MGALAIPEPAIPEPVPTLALAEVEDLAANIVAWTETAPAEAIMDRLDQVLALERYLAKRDMGGPMQTAARHMEAQIGRLLGPPQPHGTNRHTADSSVRARTLDLPPPRHGEFYRLAHYWPEVEARLPCSRAQALHACLEAEHRAGNRRKATAKTRRGDFRKVLTDIPDDSVALVLTDPPYNAEATPLYGDLGAFAARVLVPGGSLIAYAGHAHLPEVFDALSPHLRYWWTLCLQHRFSSSRMVALHIYVRWKPIVWFVKGGRRDGIMVSDTIEGEAPDKSRHEWAQGDECGRLIEDLTLPGETVVDPFAGSGTFGEAIVRLGRNYIGAEIR